MTEITSEPGVTVLEGIAARIFAGFGVDFASARRAGGWSNITWLAGGLALRLATRAGNANIRRDARLAALLPVEVGYPVTVQTGVTDGFEWCLSREIPGCCLGEIWPRLSLPEQGEALRQLWAKAQAVHRVDPAAAAGLVRQRAWFNSNDPHEADASLACRVQEGLFTYRQAAVLRGILARFWQALPAAVCLLNHGDLTLDNAIWQQGRVVSLLDFEFALLAPIQLDLNTLLAPALGPGQQDESLRRAAVRLAVPELATPGSVDLLLGYAVLLELWRLQEWLAHPEGEGPLEQWDPYRRLLALAEGQGGYYAPVLMEVR
jgi:aminoglycoside phosphotransferase (APT) family kinase protein